MVAWSGGRYLGYYFMYSALQNIRQSSCFKSRHNRGVGDCLITRYRTYHVTQPIKKKIRILFSVVVMYELCFTVFYLYDHWCKSQHTTINTPTFLFLASWFYWRLNILVKNINPPSLLIWSHSMIVPPVESNREHRTESSVIEYSVVQIGHKQDNHAVT